MLEKERNQYFLLRFLLIVLAGLLAFTGIMMTGCHGSAPVEEDDLINEEKEGLSGEKPDDGEQATPERSAQIFNIANLYTIEIPEEFQESVQFSFMEYEVVGGLSTENPDSMTIYGTARINYFDGDTKIWSVVFTGPASLTIDENLEVWRGYNPDILVYEVTFGDVSGWLIEPSVTNSTAFYFDGLGTNPSAACSFQMSLTVQDQNNFLDYWNDPAVQKLLNSIRVI